MRTVKDFSINRNRGTILYSSVNRSCYDIEGTKTWCTFKTIINPAFLRVLKLTDPSEVMHEIISSNGFIILEVSTSVIEDYSKKMFIGQNKHYIDDDVKMAKRNNCNWIRFALECYGAAEVKIDESDDYKNSATV